MPLAFVPAAALRLARPRPSFSRRPARRPPPRARSQQQPAHHDAPSPSGPPDPPTSSTLAALSTEPSVTRQLMALALPALGALALDPLLSLIDTAFVGRLGVAPIAGVSLATLLLNLSYSLFNFLCISITPIVASAIHQDPSDPSIASRPIATALHLALLLGLFSASILFFFARPLSLFLAASPEVLPHAIVYLRARAIAIPLALATLVINGSLRALKDLRTPFYVAMIANFTNVSLDLLFIFRFSWGVAGAALATSLSQVLAFVLMLAHLFRTSRLRLSHLLRIQPFSAFRPMLSAGVMLAVRTCSILSTVAYATATAATRGVVSLAAFELCRQLWVFNATLLDSLAAAAQALVASAIAARFKPQARLIATRAIFLSILASLLIAVPALIAAPTIPTFFTTSPEVTRIAANCIRVAAICAPINGTVFALDGVFAACADYTYLAAGIALAAMAACMAITAVRVSGAGVVMVWAALNVLMVARCVVLLYRFFSADGPISITPSQSAAPP